MRNEPVENCLALENTIAMTSSVSNLFEPPKCGERGNEHMLVSAPSSTTLATTNSHKTYGAGCSEVKTKKPRLIGKGSFSTVFYLKGRAIKLVSVHHSQMLEREYKVLKLLEGCCNIIRAIRLSHREGKESFLVMEYGGRDMFDALPFLTAEDKMFTYLQVSHALEYMHERDIVHLDIKVENVVIDATRRVRIVDFGFARVLSAQECTVRSMKGVIGSRAYSCPEMLRSALYNGFEADSWSMGVFLFVMWHNCMLWTIAVAAIDMRFAHFEKHAKLMSSSAYFQKYCTCGMSATPEWVWAIIDATIVLDPDRRQRRWSLGVGGTNVTFKYPTLASNSVQKGRGCNNNMHVIFQWLDVHVEIRRGAV